MTNSVDDQLISLANVREFVLLPDEVLELMPDSLPKPEWAIAYDAYLKEHPEVYEKLYGWAKRTKDENK